MRDDNRSLRQEQIEQAAYDVLEARGYSGTSMLTIARKARASNETLYNWYGDKTGLFKALVARNAAEVKQLLEADLQAATDPLHTLRSMGPRLLGILTGARAVALNRAAAAEFRRRTGGPHRKGGAGGNRANDRQGAREGAGSRLPRIRQYR